nr:unnamed protein product [Callosobruchus chinensis]
MFFFFAGAVPLPFRFRSERPPAQPAASRPDEEVRQPQDGRERHQRTQVVCVHRLDSHIPKENRSALHTQV